MEHTIIDSDAINTTKRELDTIFKFFEAAPHVLAENSVVSDPFVLIRHLINTDWGNMTARLLFTSARKLYRDFGSNSTLYFEMVKDLYTALSGCTHQAEARTIIEEWRDTAMQAEALDCSTLESLESGGFDATVSEAIYKADGGLIRIIADETTPVPFIDTQVISEFPVVDSPDFEAPCTDTLVLLKPLGVRQLASLCSGKHTLIISLGHSRKLTDFAAQNATRVTLIEVYQEYATQDVFMDLCALTSQVNSPGGIPQSHGSVLCATVNSGMLKLYPKRTRLYTKTLSTLMRKAETESSPLIRQTLETRLARLLSETVDIHYPARTLPEATSNESHYMTQLLEASNSLSSGLIPADRPMSAQCYATCVNLAASDMYGLFSPLKITKQYTDD